MEIEPRAFVYSSTVSEMLGENDFIKEYTMFNKILETTNATLKVNKKYNIKPFNKKKKYSKEKENLFIKLKTKKLNWGTPFDLAFLTYKIF